MSDSPANNSDSTERHSEMMEQIYAILVDLPEASLLEIAEFSIKCLSERAQMRRGE